MSNTRVVTFGEIMGRLNPVGYLRFVQSKMFEMSYAGGEANVAASLANFGIDAAFVTKVPDNEIGQSAINSCREFGVDTSFVVKGGCRLGLYFVEKGFSQRASKVIYDRTGSSIATAALSDFDWDKIFEGATWFHFTGITPALGGDLPQICLSACKKAKEKGLTISCDLNYRRKLWASEQAGKCMAQYMPYIDVCIANEEDCADVFGIKAQGVDIEKGNVTGEAYISVAEQLAERFGIKIIAITLRGSINANINNWSGMLYMNGKAVFAPEYQVHIVDRVGGGDSFGAGLIYALSMKYAPQDAIDFAVAASCLKHTIEHDFNLVSVSEVESLASGNVSGRVQR